MKNFTYSLLIMLIFASCGSSNTISKTSEDKALVNAIKKLDKNPQNAELRTTLKNLYTEAAKSHLDKIDVYNNDLTGTEKWDKIIPEYEALKKLAEVISSSSVATNLLNVSNYGNELHASKESAADEYYQSGMILMKDDSKMSAREAYYSFRKANEYIPNYKDTKKQMDSAYKAGTINVVVNPVRDNTFYSNSIGRNGFGNQFNNDNFQQNLVRDLGGNYNKTTNSLIFTDWEARRQNVRADWEIDLTWTDLNIPQPISYQSTKNVSRQIETSRDTSGKVYYQTVTATVYTTQRQFTATGDMEVRITDMDSRKTVLSTRYTEQYNWQDETSTYTGDRRALEGYDLSRMSNTGRYREPRREDILNELYRRMYPQIRNRIQTALRF